MDSRNINNEADPGEKAGFLESPPPILASEIGETRSADVVVVGAGISGLTAAVSAAESGARTILIEKGPGFSVRGLHNAALNSRLQKQAGIKSDRDKVISTIMEFSGYRADQRIVTLWADNCDKVMDWLLDLADEAGLKVMLDTTTKDWYFPNYPLIHVFGPKMQESLAQMLLDKARTLGVEVLFNTPAKRLIRENGGRVSGVIAHNQKGLLRINVDRAVVLCTGDYGGDREMVKHYCWPVVSRLKCAYEPVYDPVLNSGDGHKMALWVGAAIDEPPHCAMLFDWAVWSKRGIFNLARQPWLYVNIRGQRFMNEDLPWGYECAQMLLQPEGFAWSVWDSKWPQESAAMHSQCCKNMGSPTFLWDPKQLKEALELGNVLQAESITELAEKMDVPAAAFTATVDRYNEMARMKQDLDFGKHPDRLTTLEKAPFFACKMETRYMVILSGLKINTSLQVLDTQGNPVPGLFAAGNTSGSFFGAHYSTTTPGVTHSRAWTFGRLAGQNAAACR